MSWLKDLASGLGLQDFYDDAAKKVARWNNATFKNGMMAACALIAAADGTIEEEEKHKVAGLIKSNKVLSVFSATELRDLFFGYCDEAKDEFKRIDLYSLVGKLKGHSDQADTAIRVAIIIANSDGNFAPEEKNVVRELCATLGLQSVDYLHD